jgi:eukaryotic-like serine/threonine-protein kinase
MLAKMPKSDLTPTTTPPHISGEAIDLEGQLAPGDRAGEYVILGTIATGGCGTVYSAEHRVLGRRAAVKVLHGSLATSPEMIERFVREARIVNRIRHPHIVDIYEFGELTDRRPYFVMELLTGSSLGVVVEQRGRLVPAQALAYLEPVCDALAAAHAAGVVHRDLKASNVAVVKDGDAPQVKLLDFGIAKLLRNTPGERGLTAVGQRIGTPYAMSPEQIRGGAIDARTDIYALGVLLFQLFTGRYPFMSDDPVEMERLHVEAPPPRPSALAPTSPAVDAVVLRCLEKDPAKRFPDVGSLLTALRAAVRGTVKAARQKRGVAIYAEVRLPAEEPDDALLSGLAALLDHTEALLRDAGFSLYLQTGSALLGVRALPDDAAHDREARAAALHVARSLLDPGAGSDPRLGLAVQVHADEVQLRDGPGGAEVVGGPLVDLGSWIAEGAGHLRTTPQASDGIEPAP